MLPQDLARSLYSVEEAQERIMDAVKPLPPVELPLLEAWGCVLAGDVAAAYDIPTFPSSSMDGYAVRAEDIRGASPKTPVALRKVGEAPIGHPPKDPVGPGETVWIATGAPGCIATL